MKSQGPVPVDIQNRDKSWEILKRESIKDKFAGFVGPGILKSTWNYTILRDATRDLQARFEEFFETVNEVLRQSTPEGEKPEQYFVEVKEEPHKAIRLEVNIDGLEKVAYEHSAYWLVLIQNDQPGVKSAFKAKLIHHISDFPGEVGLYENTTTDPQDLIDQVFSGFEDMVLNFVRKKYDNETNLRIYIALNEREERSAMQNKGSQPETVAIIKPGKLLYPPRNE
jgi:hypothetical protein